jgi:hypothetical protein
MSNTTPKRRVSAKRLESIKRSWQHDNPQQAAEQFERLQDAAGAKSISGQLRRAIHDSGKAITQIAKSAGIDARNLSEWLKGERNLRSDVLDRIGLAIEAAVSITAGK